MYTQMCEVVNGYVNICGKKNGLPKQTTRSHVYEKPLYLNIG